MLIPNVIQKLRFVSKFELWKILVIVFMASSLELLSLTFFGITTSSLLSGEPFFSKTIDKLYYMETLFRGLGNITQLSIYISLFLLSNCYLVYATWTISLTSAKIGNGFADRIFEFIVGAKWERFRSLKESEILSSSTSQVVRLTNGVITPALLFLLKLSNVLIISSVILLTNPTISAAVLAILSSLYAFMFIIIRPTVTRLGQSVTELLAKRQAELLKAIGLSREIRTYDLEVKAHTIFLDLGKKLSHAQGNIGALSIIPRYLIEFLVFGSFVAVLAVDSTSQTHTLIPDISFLGFALLRLLPNIQYLFTASTTIKGNISSLQILDAFDLEFKKKASLKHSVAQKQDFLTFKDVSYCSANKSILLNATFTLPPKGLVLIRGKSGSGKTTLSEIICGLRDKTSGTITHRGTSCPSDDLAKMFTLIPQRPFVNEESVLCNINLYEPVENENANNQGLIKYLIETNLVTNKQNAYEFVQFSASNLSGGQIQRLAIVRALLLEKNGLILDEPTSALDRDTESKVVSLLQKLKNERLLIVITHADVFDAIADVTITLSQGRIESVK